MLTVAEYRGLLDMADLKCNLVLGCLVIANPYRCMSSWFNTDSQCYLRHGDIFKRRVSGESQTGI